MQMVEDFSLMSESDSENEDCPKPASALVLTPSKPRVAQMEDREVAAVVTSNEDMLLREMLKRFIFEQTKISIHTRFILAGIKSWMKERLKINFLTNILILNWLKSCRGSEENPRY